MNKLFIISFSRPLYDRLVELQKGLISEFQNRMCFRQKGVEEK